MVRGPRHDPGTSAESEGLGGQDCVNRLGAGAVPALRCEQQAGVRDCRSPAGVTRGHVKVAPDDHLTLASTQQLRAESRPERAAVGPRVPIDRRHRDR
eukprot:15440831-Alexandrium_andersonii.AAC.1